MPPHKPKMSKNLLSSEEYDKIGTLVQSMTHKKYINWKQVAKSMDFKRTAAEYKRAYHYRFRPRVRREHNMGRWEKEEDDRLVEAVELYLDAEEFRNQDGTKKQRSQQWTLIANLLETRGGPACRRRWNVLKKYINPEAGGPTRRRPFTAEEDSELLAAYTLHGNQWSKFDLPGRSRQALLTRYRALTKGEDVSDSGPADNQSEDEAEEEKNRGESESEEEDDDEACL